MKRNNLITRFFLLSMLLALTGFSAFAQKDILLYSTDFTDWGAISNSNSSAIVDGMGAGAGFKLSAKPQVKPDLGIYCSDNSTNYIQFKPFDFISGGVVELTFTLTNKNNKHQTISGVTSTAGRIMSSPPLDAKTPSTMSATQFTSGKETGDFVVEFEFSDMGTKTIKIAGDSKCGEMDIKGIKVYTGVGTVPYVASTNYPKAPAAGYTMQGVTGGAANSGTPVGDLVNIKGYNIGTHDVRLTIVGDDKFSFTDDAANGFTLQTDGSLIVSNNKAIAGVDINVLQFTPSIKPGVSSAVLKIEEIGGTAVPYEVSLSGLTGGTTPQIIAEESQIPFWGAPISSTTKQLFVAGLNLTGDVSLSLSGTGASKFELAPLKLTRATALKGVWVSIRYTADISFPSTDEATLTISSPGAASKVVPLIGYTLDSKPKLIDLYFEVVPGGSAIVATDIAGPKYLKGTVVTTTVEPETGWAINYWSDAAGNRSKERKFKISDKMPAMPIKIFLTKIGDIPPPDPTSTFVAYPPSNVTGTGFTGIWSSAEDATEYIVVVYDNTEKEIGRYPNQTGNMLTIGSLTEGEFYYYEVIAITTSGTDTTGKVGPFQTTPNTSTYTCGQ